MKLNRYTISCWINNLKWNYRNLYHAFCTFVLLMCAVYALCLFIGPGVLAGLYSGWFILLEFITIPTIVGTLGWVANCFGF